MDPRVQRGVAAQTVRCYCQQPVGVAAGEGEDGRHHDKVEDDQKDREVVEQLAVDVDELLAVVRVHRPLPDPQQQGYEGGGVGQQEEHEVALDQAVVDSVGERVQELEAQLEEVEEDGAHGGADGAQAHFEGEGARVLGFQPRLHPPHAGAPPPHEWRNKGGGDRVLVAAPPSAFQPALEGDQGYCDVTAGCDEQHQRDDVDQLGDAQLVVEVVVIVVVRWRHVWLAAVENEKFWLANVGR